MASHLLSAAMRLYLPSSVALRAPIRNFQTSSRRFADATPLPVRKPVGAFRGGLFGFLLGSTLAGGGVYYYIIDEYKISNELLTEDIYSLHAAVQRVHTYVQTLEEKLDAMERKEKK